MMKTKVKVRNNMVHENCCVETQNLSIWQQKCAWRQPKTVTKIYL